MTTPTQAQIAKIDAQPRTTKGVVLLTTTEWNDIKAALTAAAQVEKSCSCQSMDECNERAGCQIAAAQVGEPSRNAKLEIEQLTRELVEKEAATIERCAQVAESFPSTGDPQSILGMRSRHIAAAIRKLKVTTDEHGVIGPKPDPNIVYPGKDPDFTFPEEGP